jgi:hypothetical protein
MALLLDARLAAGYCTDSLLPGTLARHYLRTSLLASSPNMPKACRALDDDFEACVAHLHLPVTPGRSTRATNLVERLFVALVQGYGRIDIIGYYWSS